MKRYYLLLIVLLAWSFSYSAFTQDNDLDSLLKASIKDAPALNEKVSISVSNTSIQEFMRGVANSSGLNIDVDPSMDIRIVNQFL
jgi:type IV pilus assembly protein PilQ